MGKATFGSYSETLLLSAAEMCAVMALCVYVKYTTEITQSGIENLKISLKVRKNITSRESVQGVSLRGTK
jgi:hypothetical protein